MARPAAPKASGSKRSGSATANSKQKKQNAPAKAKTFINEDSEEEDEEQDSEQGDSAGEEENVEEEEEEVYQQTVKKTKTATGSRGRPPATKDKGKGRALPVDDDDQSSLQAGPAMVRLQREVARLQRDLEATRNAYDNALEINEKLKELRTKSEIQNAELTEQSDIRVEAARRSVATYASELEEAKAEIKALQEEVAVAKSAKRRRGEDDEEEEEQEAEDDEEEEREDGNTTTTVPETQFSNAGGKRLKTSSSVNVEEESVLKQLRRENAKLAEQNEQLDQTVQELREKAAEVQKSLKVAKEDFKEERLKLHKEIATKADVERKRAEQELKAAQELATQLQKELEFETAHSKKLQNQISGVGGLNSSMGASQSQGAAPSTKPTSKSSDVHETLNKVLLEMTGIEVVRFPIPAEPSTYNCLISDVKKKRCLGFKLVAHLDSNEISFIPDLQPGRDDEVLKHLDKNLHGHIKFAWEHLPSFFKKLWRSLNEGKK